MKTSESKIKFYNKYWYKLEYFNTLAHIFREKQFVYSKTCLEAIQQDYDKGNELFLRRQFITSPVSNLDFLDAKVLLAEFEKQKDEYTIRVENPILAIYSNNINWLQFLATRTYADPVLHKPSIDIKELLENESRVVILKKPTKFKYKVTLRNRVNSDFSNWIDNNPDKIKIGKKAYQHIKGSGYAHGYYFYCTSEKVLSLLQIMIGGNISKVEQVIVDPTIDK